MTHIFQCCSVCRSYKFARHLTVATSLLLGRLIWKADEPCVWGSESTSDCLSLHSVQMALHMVVPGKHDMRHVSITCAPCLASWPSDSSLRLARRLLSQTQLLWMADCIDTMKYSRGDMLLWIAAKDKCILWRTCACP